MRRLWEFLATGLIVCVPCLWWLGVPQDEAQVEAWHVLVVALVAVSAGFSPKRQMHSQVLGFGLLAAGVTSVLTYHGAGYSVLILHALMAWLGCWVLVTYAPSASWITRRLTWVVWANLAYVAMQLIGYDPLFDRTGIRHPFGLSGTRTQLGIVLMVGSVFVSSWSRSLCFLGAVFSGSWTGMAGVLAGGLKKTSGREGVASLVGIAIVVLLGAWMLPDAWAMRMEPRLAAWRAAFGNGLWSPIYGYGLGVWEAGFGKIPELGPKLYSQYLWAWHVGGGLLLVPLIGYVRRVWTDAPSPERWAVILLAIAALGHQLWASPRLVVVTLAVVAAYECRRIDADRPAPRVLGTV